jgi:hypothetical protein
MEGCLPFLNEKDGDMLVEGCSPFHSIYQSK